MKKIFALTSCAAFALVGSIAMLSLAGAQSTKLSENLPVFNDKGELELPVGFRQWVFLGSPLTPNALNGGAAGFPEYHNVYVQPEAFNAYRETGKWPEGERIISVRELAGQIEVNPNTVMRAYALLQEEEILYNKGGIGFFVSIGAVQKIHRKSKASFIKNELQVLFEKMNLLDIEMSELNELYKQYKHSNKK